MENVLPQIKTIFNPISFGTFKPTTYKPEQEDMGLLQRSMSELEARQKDASLQRQALDKTLAEIQSKLHNDDETNAWFTDYKNNILDRINSHINTGNYGVALREAIEEAGKVVDDQRVQGRLKSEANYQKAMEEIDKRRLSGDISKETAEYAKFINPYYHFDHYNKKGEVTGGSDWEATNVVNDINWAETSLLAFKLINPDVISTDSQWSSQDAYLKNYSATGEPIKDPKTGEILNDSKNAGVETLPDGTKLTVAYGGRNFNRHSEVTKEQIAQNINNILNGIPDGRAKVEQAFKVAKYQYDKLNVELKHLQESQRIQYTPERAKEIADLEKMMQDRSSIISANGQILPNTLENYTTYAVNMIYNNMINTNLAYVHDDKATDSTKRYGLVHYPESGGRSSGGGGSRTDADDETNKPEGGNSVEQDARSNFSALQPNRNADSLAHSYAKEAEDLMAEFD